MNVTQRLTEQNNGQAWLDCNDHGLPHRWVADQVPQWFRCRRCPVTTRTNRVRPMAWLGFRSPTPREEVA